MTTLFSIIESPGHPRLDSLFQRLGIKQIKLPSQRKALQALKRTAPNWASAVGCAGMAAALQPSPQPRPPMCAGLAIGQALGVCEGLRQVAADVLVVLGQLEDGRGIAQCCKRLPDRERLAPGPAAALELREVERCRRLEPALVRFKQPLGGRRLIATAEMPCQRADIGAMACRIALDLDQRRDQRCQ
jgi:hypothetical protein